MVSPSSKARDYDEKPEEYLQFRIQEYWIIDADKRQMIILQRSRGRWAAQIIRPPKTYKTHLLPGLEFSCESIFRAAEVKKS